jgi:hypothetical protein
MSRIPAVANMFYPGNPDQLRKELSAFITPVSSPRKVLAAICPHAGYVYSGKVAGAVFSQIHVPSTAIILGPNHRGLGAPVALQSAGSWEMPLGTVSVHEELAGKLLVALGDQAQDDPQAHAMEHSLEVQVPFLQMIQPDLTIVPVSLSHITYNTCEAVGRVMGQTIQEWPEPVLLLASTDMSHYVSAETAKSKDQLAIDKILALDPEGLFRTVAEHRISMCGVIPTTITLVAAKVLGASKAELVQYATSGDVTGDFSQVVGYAGLIVY